MSSDAPAHIATAAELQALPRASFEKDCILGAPLPAVGIEARDAASWATKVWWETCLHGGAKSKLTFAMVGRLVELLLRVNPKILSLRMQFNIAFSIGDTPVQDMLRVGLGVVFHCANTLLRDLQASDVVKQQRGIHGCAVYPSASRGPSRQGLTPPRWVHARGLRWRR
jgi:hypothetical protein